jgi:hypothetical protein
MLQIIKICRCVSARRAAAVAAGDVGVLQRFSAVPGFSRY